MRIKDKEHVSFNLKTNTHVFLILIVVQTHHIIWVDASWWPRLGEGEARRGDTRGVPLPLCRNYFPSESAVKIPSMDP